MYVKIENASEEENMILIQIFFLIKEIVPKEGNLIIMSDFSAQVRKEDCYREIARTQTMHEQIMGPIPHVTSQQKNIPSDQYQV